MDVIRGSTRPRRGRRWWAPRPNLQLVRDPRPVQTSPVGEDTFLLAMIASFCLFLLAFAMFMGVWTGG